MVKKYFEFTKDLEFVKTHISILEKEYVFWKNERTVEISGKKVNLNNYNVTNKTPRPESYIEDLEMSHHLNTTEEKEKMYKDIASAAESGWDFSSRWFKEPTQMKTIETSDIIPVDLNAVLYKVEEDFRYFFELLGNKEKSEEYKSYASERMGHINQYLWNDQKCWWNDFNVNTNVQNSNTYLSNILPIWAHSNFMTEEKTECFLKSIDIFNSYEGGRPASLINSGQQWDFPNAWAPLEYFFVEALENLKNETANKYAKIAATQWLENNYCSWLETDKMYEKYNAETIGQEGHGGEYPVQDGFGWTNGVALYLLNKYPDTQINNCASKVKVNFLKV